MTMATACYSLKITVLGPVGPGLYFEGRWEYPLLSTHDDVSADAGLAPEPERKHP